MIDDDKENESERPDFSNTPLEVVYRDLYIILSVVFVLIVIILVYA